MSSTITIYTKGVNVELLNGDIAYETDGEVQVTLEADANDFVSEFMTDEILNEIDFPDIERYYLINKGLDDEDWSAALWKN